MCTPTYPYLSQCFLPEGATLIPLILALDKTNLMIMSSGKQAHLVYITIGNIPSSLRRQSLSGATEVLAYRPVAKFEGYAPAKCCVLQGELFHRSMIKVLEPLRAARQSGIDLQCADGLIRSAYPIYSSHLADHQEQVQIACVQGCRCPMCQVARKELGLLTVYPP
jgi:hypothetical protein